MKLSIIHALVNEARSHADQNPKISVNQHIANALQKATKAKDRVGGIYNVFVSMTSIDKLGINPQSEYDTPLGIYAYPAIFVYKQAKADRELTGALPFAGEQPFANIFNAKGNIINLGTITDSEVIGLYKKIAAVFHKYSQKSWKADVDVVERLINEASTQAKKKSLPGGQLWYVTMRVAVLLRVITGTAAPTMWNKLFREIGVDGVIDMGKGIVHTNEPTQAVFFSVQAIDKVDRVDNKYSPDAMAAGKVKGDDARAMKQYLSTQSEQQLIDRIQTATSEQMAVILKVSNSPNVQMAAVEASPHNIQYIKNPSEKLQMMAVMKAGAAIRHIRNPSEQLQIAAVEASSTAIRYIKNPSEAVQIAAVKAYPHSVGSIKNPSEAVQMAMVHASPSKIYLLKNPTDKVRKFVADITNRQ